VIDLHTHLLPGVDDGAKTVDEAVAMVRVARENGIAAMVATPHRNAWSYWADRSDGERRLADVVDACARAGLTVRLALGSEAYMAPDLVEQVRRGQVWTINGGRYLLVEWPYEQYPPYSEQVLFDLQIKGLCPIVAHPERYRVVRRDVAVLAPLVERGMVVQVTASGLLGKDGPEVQRIAETLLVRNLAHLLASDAHGPTRRPPLLRAARERASELVGEARAQAMVQDGPEQVLENRTLDLPPPSVQPPKSFWEFWR
jgi:protein-tyrosine phosphatase